MSTGQDEQHPQETSGKRKEKPSKTKAILWLVFDGFSFLFKALAEWKGAQEDRAASKDQDLLEKVTGIEARLKAKQPKVTLPHLEACH